jgi:hypothetical protein
MNTLDFLQRVLPSDGYYVAVAIKNKKVLLHRFVDNIVSLETVVDGISAGGGNAYFAVASFVTNTGGRKQDNVHSLKSLYLDIDCGVDKPYLTQRDGLKALSTFVKETQLPTPMIVSSGNGLHAYWILDRELPRDEWQPLADALKNATQQLKFEVDPVVPADSARILRPVGTINTKGGELVTSLLAKDETHNVEYIDRILSPYRVNQIKIRPPSAQFTPLIDLSTKTEFPPTSTTAVVDKCQQIRWGVENQKKVQEPFWYALLGIAAYCEDPEATAVAWSKDHPEYSYDKTVAKLEHWKASVSGPTTCNKFQELRSSGCDKCKFKGSITTPCSIGVTYKSVEIDPSAPDEVAHLTPLPRAYKRASDGGIKQTIDSTDVDICPFDLYPVGYGRDEALGYETVRYRWNRPHAGWQPLVFRQAYLADGSREFASAIADQGIVLLHKHQTEKFQMLLRTYMDELRKMKAMTNIHTSMGWKDDRSQFLIGDTLFRRHDDGSVSEEVVSISQTSNRAAPTMYGVSGTLEEATNFTSIIDKGRLPIQGWAMMIGLAAPMFEFTGIKGLTINLYGPSGSGKSLAQLMIQSLWGNPDMLHYASKFTHNALYARMGLCNNLPMTIDEATTMAAKDIGDFLYDVSQGREKARLTRTAEERNARTWRLPCITSANKSLNASLISTGLETDAQMMRLFEITVTPHPLFEKSTDAGQRIYNFVSVHYGTIGRAFIRKLLEIGAEDLATIIDNHKAEFTKKYNCKFEGTERFWEQSVILADLAGKLACEWGLFKFDYTKCTNAVLSQMGSIRKNVQENITDSFDLIAEYLNAHSGSSITATHTGGSKVYVDTTRLPRGDVRIRFDLYRPSHSDPYERGVVLLDKAHFKRWLSNNGADMRTVMKDIIAANADATPKIGKAYLAKDSSIKLGQTYVIGVSLQHPRLVGILTDKDDNAINNDLAGLTVLQGGRAD